jgi:hypothetical protein
MRFPIATLSGAVALVCLASSAGLNVALAASNAPGQVVPILTPLKLDAARLLSMQAGQKVAIAFPVVGSKTVVFETTTKGLDGSTYWHGSIDGSPRDRVFLRQNKTGQFVGAIRFGNRQVAFLQQADSTLVEAPLAPVQGQAYTLGKSFEKGVTDIQGNLAAIAQAETGSEVSLPLPNGQVEVAVVTGSQLDDQGYLQISAVSRMDGSGSPTLITVGPQAVFGTVITNGSEYQIVTRQGKTQIVDPKAAGWAQLRGDDQADVSEPLTAAATVSGAGAATAGAIVNTTVTTSSTLKPLPAGAIDTTITLLMTYSPTYVTLWGSEAVARTRLSNLVQVANSAYAGSGTGIAFKIVGWSLVKQPDTTPQVNLAAMRADSGNFKGLNALKTTTGAAIAVFYAPFNTTTGSTSTCGLAYVPGAGSGGVAAYNAQVASSQFTALNDGQSGGYYCESLTLAHELGHTLGSVHDKANSSFTGAFAYSFGKGISGQFGTVMSYISPRVALFSSPQLTCTSSKLACGSSTENVVATFLQTKASAAKQGKASAASALVDGFTIVSGWVLNASGAPYTGATTIKPSNAAVSCTTGTTGLYVCKVPNTLTSVTVQASATGKTVTPSTGTFGVERMANMPVNGTRFYVR